MKIKEAVMLLKEFDLTEDEQKNIINLLKQLNEKSVQGEKFKKMWGELKKKNPPAVINFVETYDDVRTTIKQSKILHDFTMYRLEQKYFPKEKQ